jgi:iron complex transport system ATP-binding protein
MQLAQVKAVLGQKSNVQFDFTVEEVTLMGRYPHFQHRPCENDFSIVKKYHECLDLREYSQRSHTSLSGGEQQRNQFARVLAQLDSDVLLAKLLLLDEPLNNLDIKYQYQFMDFAKQFANKGNLVILVIHDLNIAAEYADKIVLLNEGKLYAQGTPEEVLTKSNLEACYDLPVFVSQHPYKSQPMVLFNLAAKEEIQNNQTLTIYN